MQVKAHYEGVADGLMAASRAGGSLAADALAALQAASAAGVTSDVLGRRSEPVSVSTAGHDVSCQQDEDSIGYRCGCHPPNASASLPQLTSR